jgi:hypothetical protein
MNGRGLIGGCQAVRSCAGRCGNDGGRDRAAGARSGLEPAAGPAVKQVPMVSADAARPRSKVPWDRHPITSAPAGQSALRRSPAGRWNPAVGGAGLR